MPELMEHVAFQESVWIDLAKAKRRLEKKSLHVASLCQSTMLFGIVWVLLSQAFATWRG